MRQIYLTRGQVALVDDNDFEWLSQWKWFAHFEPKTATYYAVRSQWVEAGKPQRRVIMSRQILGITDSKIHVDHKNGDTLDNQRCNLRAATAVQNQVNRRKQKNNSSGFKGVSWNASHKKWVSKISVCGKHIHLGYFESPEEAHDAYVKKAQKLHGEFARAR